MDEYLILLACGQARLAIIKIPLHFGTFFHRTELKTFLVDELTAKVCATINSYSS